MQENICFKPKGTVCVSLSDPPFKNNNARSTTLPLKPLSDQKHGRYPWLFDSANVLFYKMCEFFLQSNGK